ncbi:hypothetical protein BIW11_05582 [Tropilaelaps mercedesae]|uniref:C2 domain-containing protein n=1 Tax=Tropilaelaps mercedesae TaxID=418985 RepID=A0A1V9Y1N2_9ACAR|nr:hypothetical protein BIW11_05582 [Tropilaelaps mercedesae]
MRMENGGGWSSWRLSGNYPLLLLCVSMACLSLGAVFVYVVYSRKFRLNWFEKQRLYSLACDKATIVKLRNRQEDHSGSTCSGGSFADLTAALPPLATQSASRSSSLQKLHTGASHGAGQEQALTGCPGSLAGSSSGTGRSGICPDAQSLRSVGSSASVITTGTTHSTRDAIQPLISAATSELNVASDLSPCSDVSSVIQKYVQPSITGVGSALATGATQRPKVNTMYERIDYTKFNADMYRTEDSASMGGGGEEADSPGCIHISLTYNAHFSVLCTRVVNASGLSPAASAGGIVNPYLRVRLLPDSKATSQPKTGQVQRNTLEPQFDEDFIFNGISITDLNTKILEILILNYTGEEANRSPFVSTGSLVSGEECLGGIHWSLDQMVDPMREYNIRPLSLDLPLCSAETLRRNRPSHGELQLSLSYLQSAERLTVSVLKARSLPTVSPEHKKAGAPDAFVKLIVRSKTGKSGKASKKKKKTNVQKNTTCPIFSEAFTFNMTREALQSASLQVVVAHEVPPSLPLQQKELPLAKLYVPPGTLGDFVHSAGNGMQAKWFRLSSPTL